MDKIDKDGGITLNVHIMNSNNFLKIIQEIWGRVESCSKISWVLILSLNPKTFLNLLNVSLWIFLP